MGSVAKMFQMSKFELAVGAEPDLRELEYLAALLQTGKEIRTEGTVSSEDVRVYLRSRYGIDVPGEDALDIVRGLGGTYEEGDRGFRRASYARPDAREIMELARSDTNATSATPGDLSRQSGSSSAETAEFADEHLDLVQLTSVLLIPSLLRAKREVDLEHGVILKDPPIPDPPDTTLRLGLRHPLQFLRNRRIAADLMQKTKRRDFKNSLRPTPRRIIRDVLRVMTAAVDEAPGGERLTEAGAEEQMEGNRDDLLPPLGRVVIDEKFVRKILAAFSFSDLCNNETLVREMVQMAGGDGTILDEQVFAKILTSDVAAWECGVEDELSETFTDVYGFDPVSLEYLAGRRINKKKQLEAERDAANADEAVFSNDTDNALLVTAANGGARKSLASGGETASSEMEWVSFDEENGKIAWNQLGDRDASENIECFHGEVEIAAYDPRKPEKEHQSERPESRLEKRMVSDVKTNYPRYVPTAPYIDYVVDEYKSISYSMIVVVFYLFSAAISVAMLALVNLQPFTCDDDKFFCILGQQVWNWFVIAAVLCAAGFLVIMPLSLGNDPHRKDHCGSIVSLIWAFGFAVIPFSLLRSYKAGIPHSPDGQLTDMEKLLNQPYIELSACIFLGCGLLLAAKMLITIPGSLVPRENASRSAWLSFLFIPSSVRIGAATKQAATRKVNMMLEHAHSLHCRRFRGTKRTAIENFILYGKKMEESGGLIWTWKQILSSRLVNVHGIWLQSNLFAGQEGQLMVCVLGLILSIWGALVLGDKARAERKDLEEQPPSYLRDRALLYTPKPWMIYYSFLGGTLVAGIVSVCLMLLYIPSTVKTVMKLRSGAIETLHEPKFASYRASADTICYNVGNMIYALVGSASLFFLLVAGALFLLFWPPTQKFIIQTIAWGLGLGITIGIKMVLTMRLRSNFQAALYRKKPRKANFTMLCLMCWNIGLGGGVMLGRLIQFLFAAAFWIGRVDCTFLDDDVQFFGYSFDYVPFNYRKDILVHEAHRHPFIDRIGGLYMMRLKHGTRFSSNAGACWRQLFVVVLMPWLLKYRQSSMPDQEEALEQMAVRALSPEDSAAAEYVIPENGGALEAETVAQAQKENSDDDSEWEMKSI